MKKLLLAVLLTGLSASAFARVAYVSGADEPWNYGGTTNLTAMELAFGADGYDRLTFADAFSGIASGYDFVYVDGGAQHSEAFQTFVGDNRSALEDYVSTGGRLFLNSAIWGGSTNFDLGFGASNIAGASNSAVAVDVNHPVFDANTGYAWEGGSFSHNYVTGDGFSSIINDGEGRSVFAERQYGNGLILVGGMTTANFQTPTDAALALRVNEFTYAANAPVPEPEEYALMLLGLGLVSLAVRRSKKAEIAA